jgi:hypothetical protein
MCVPPGSDDIQQTDGTIAVPNVRPAGEDAFGADIDYATLVSCTGCTERANLTMCISIRRFTWLTNAFSKKLQTMSTWSC